MKNLHFGQEKAATMLGPNPVQELLLRAALLPGVAAADAFTTWLAIVDRDHLDVGSYRMLPLLGYNLERQEISDPFLKLCRGVHRHTWVRNQLHLSLVRELLRALRQEGIAAMVLKGAALALAYYPDPGLRPFEDIDLLVPTDLAQPAFALLSRLGWCPSHVPLREISREYAAVNHGVNMVDERGVMIDLHWHLLYECLGVDDDADFWLAAEQVQGEAEPFHILSPTGQLFHACVHGFKHQAGWESIPSIRWVADALHVIAIQGKRIDCRRLREWARERHLGLALKLTLGYLHEHWPSALPGSFMGEMASLQVFAWEKAEWRNQQKSPGILGTLPFLWRHYRRLKLGRKNGWIPCSFASYLQQQLQVTGRFELASAFFTKGMRRLKRWVREKANGVERIAGGSSSTRCRWKRY